MFRRTKYVSHKIYIQKNKQFPQTKSTLVIVSKKDNTQID